MPFQEVAPTPAPGSTPIVNDEPDEVIAKFLALGMEEF
jgi:hypothetical protein